MGRFVLSDAAPLICLAQVDGLPWLKTLFGRVHLIAITGTAAIIGAAKQRGLIPSAGDVLTALRQRGFRISESIVQGILSSVSEEPAGSPSTTLALKPIEPIRKR